MIVLNSSKGIKLFTFRLIEKLTERILFRYTLIRHEQIYHSFSKFIQKKNNQKYRKYFKLKKILCQSQTYIYKAFFSMKFCVDASTDKQTKTFWNTNRVATIPRVQKKNIQYKLYLRIYTFRTIVWLDVFLMIFLEVRYSNRRENKKYLPIKHSIYIVLYKSIIEHLRIFP